MRLYCSLDSSNPGNQLVNAFGSEVPLTEYQVKRRDASLIEFQPFTGVNSQLNAAASRIYTTIDLTFALKVAGDYQGEFIVEHTTWEWIADPGYYRGTPDLNTLQLAAAFVEASTASLKTADYTLLAADVGTLVAMQAATSKVFTLPADLGANGDVIYLLRAGAGAVTISHSGITLTDAGGLAAGLVREQTVKLTRTSATAWTLTVADELDSVTFAGEFTWRNLDPTSGYQTTADFTIEVFNDYIRGSENEPTDATAPTLYVTQADLTAEVIAEVDTRLGTAITDEVTSQLGALSLEPISGVIPGISYPDALIGETPITWQVVNIAADKLNVGDVIEFTAYGTHYHETGETMSWAVMLDAEEVLMTRDCITEKNGSSQAFVMRGSIIVTAIGATGSAQCCFDVTSIGYEGDTEKGHFTEIADYWSGGAFGTGLVTLAIDTTAETIMYIELRHSSGALPANCMAIGHGYARRNNY